MALAFVLLFILVTASESAPNMGTSYAESGERCDIEGSCGSLDDELALMQVRIATSSLTGKSRKKWGESSKKEQQPQQQHSSKSNDNCAPCMPMANAALGSSCSDAVCVVQAFAKQKDNLMAQQDGIAKLMGVYACAQQNKCNLSPNSAAGKEAQSLGLFKDAPPSFLQISSIIPPSQLLIGDLNDATNEMTTCVLDTCFAPTSSSAKCTLEPLDDACCHVAGVGRLRLSGMERWELSQKTEREWWGRVAGGDQHAMDSLGNVAIPYYFNYYSMLPCNLGDVAELGSGAYTKLRNVLEAAQDLKTCHEGFKVTSYTAIDPLAEDFAKGDFDVGTFESGDLCVKKNQFWSGGCVPTTTISGDKVNSPLPKNAFDTVIMINTLSYVPNAGDTLTSLHGALRPGGILIVMNDFVEDAVECEGYPAQSSHPICLTRAFYQWFFKRFFIELHYQEAKGLFFKMEDAPVSLDQAPRVKDCGVSIGMVESMCSIFAVLKKL